MKRLLFFILMPLFCNSQELPINSENKVVFEYIDTASGVAKDEIFSRAKSWFAEKNSNFSKKLLSEDKETLTLNGSGIFEVFFTKGVYKGETHFSYYALEIRCKDSVYRIRIHGFVMDDKYAIEICKSVAEKSAKDFKNYEDYFLWASIRSKSIRSDLNKKIKVKDDF